MNLDLTGKTAWVCGSTQGIGKAIAHELALLGANVTLLARNEEKLKEVCANLPRKKKNQKHRFLVVDFSKSKEVRTKVQKHIAKYPEVHILINNGGGPAGGVLIDTDTEKLQNTFTEQIVIAHILAQTVMPSMRDAHFGRIVNIISVGLKQPIVGLGVSNTIRGAMGSWAKTMSLELGKYGITVNNVLPGYTRTQRLEQVNEMRAKLSGKSVEEVENQLISEIPIGRFASAEEVASAAVFLCTPAAASINGINIPVDGGKTGSL